MRSNRLTKGLWWKGPAAALAAIVAAGCGSGTSGGSGTAVPSVPPSASAAVHTLMENPDVKAAVGRLKGCLPANTGITIRATAKAIKMVATSAGRVSVATCAKLTPEQRATWDVCMKDKVVSAVKALRHLSEIKPAAKDLAEVQFPICVGQALGVSASAPPSNGGTGTGNNSPPPSPSASAS